VLLASALDAQAIAKTEKTAIAGARDARQLHDHAIGIAAADEGVAGRDHLDRVEKLSARGVLEQEPEAPERAPCTRTRRDRTS
jgi:hypothetical protein